MNRFSNWTQADVDTHNRKVSKKPALAPAQPKPSRYNSGWRVIGNQRVFFRSRWEANYARYLEWQKSQGYIREWEHEPITFWFEKIRRGCRSYLPDFRVTGICKSVRYYEVKGWMDPKSKTKLKRMKKYHPEVSLAVVDKDWFKSNQPKLKKIIPGWE